MGIDDPRSFRARGVERLLEPRSIAIIGFSQKPGSGGRNCLDGLLGGGFPGEIHLVGRTPGVFEGRAVLGSVAELPSEVDLAVLNVPAAAVQGAVEDCLAKGIPAGVVFASGFAELGAEARQVQEEISARARAGGLALVGPNCMGYTNFRNGLTIGFMPVPAPARLPADAPPGAAIVTQSGGLMTHLHAGLSARRIPVPYRISTGNEASLGLTDFVEHLAHDPAVQVIITYAEHIRHPQDFLQGVRKVRALGKHVVLLHTGRGERARQAAASHTGALASDYQAMQLQVTRAGGVVVETLEELLDVTEMLVRFPVAPTRPLGIMTTSGAVCALAHDYCDSLDVEMATLGEATCDALAARLPSYVAAQNPLDLTTQVMWDDALIGDCAQQLLADPAVGSVCIVVPAGDPARGQRWLTHLIPHVQGQPKPLILTLLGDQTALAPEYEEMARSGGLILSRSPERSLRTLARVTRHGREETTAAGPAPQNARVLEVAQGLEGVVAEWQGKQLLAAAGVPVPAGGLATSLEEALALARGIGYPVVAKVQASQLAHKTEVGGVILGIGGPDELRSAWQTLHARAAAASPGLRLDGILVERMAGKGLELMVGAKRDAAWGAMLMVGLGGVWVEVLRDTRLLPADADHRQVLEALRQLKAHRLLEGFRGAPALDVAAVADVVVALGGLMRAVPTLEEIDVNPLLVMPEGVLALDALVASRCGSTQAAVRNSPDA